MFPKQKTERREQSGREERVDEDQECRIGCEVRVGVRGGGGKRGGERSERSFDIKLCVVLCNHTGEGVKNILENSEASPSCT